MNIDRIQPAQLNTVSRHLCLCSCRSVFGLTLALAAVALLAGCRTTGTPTQAGSGTISPIPADSFAVEWTALLQLNDLRVKALSLNEDRVFVAASDNRVYWLDRARGSILTSAQVAKPQDALFPPVTFLDQVAFPSTDNLAFFTRNGKFIHNRKLRFGASCGAMGDKELIFVGIDHPYGSRITTLPIAPQAYETPPQWELATGAQVAAMPAIYQGLLFVGDRAGNVYAVRADNRAALWPGLGAGFFQTGGEIVADLQADKDGVYVASNDAKLYCLDMNNGHVRWVYYAGTPLRQQSSPFVTSNRIYLYVPGQGIIAIDKTGKQEIRRALWTVAEGRQILAVDEKHVYLRSADNAILAVDSATGQVLFRSQRTDYTLFATNTSTKDNLIYAATDKGAIYAIKPVFTGGAMGELALNRRPLAGW